MKFGAKIDTGLSALQNHWARVIMTHPQQQWLKYIGGLFLTLTILYLFVWFVLPSWVDPQLQRFADYRRLQNWDLKQHARGDFDGDGQEDLISFTGCAFLSAMKTSDIPPAQQCTATGISSITFAGETHRLGQKYIPTTLYDLNLAAFEQGLPVTHSYLGRQSGKNWRIFVTSTGSHREIYEITNTGLLVASGPSTLANQIDEVLYSVSQTFLIWAPTFSLLTAAQINR